MKRHWIARAISSFLVTNMALGGWARTSDVSLDTYIPLAIFWFIIIYSLSGLIFKEKKPDSKNISSNKINAPTPKPPSPKPIEEKPLKPINQNTSVEEMPTNIKTSDEEVKVSEKEKKEIWNNISITTSEEEKIYEKVAIEVEKDRKEGIWTKALVQSDGDENKTKIQYIKLRVEIITNELIEKKFEEGISTFIQQKKRALKIKKIIFEEKQRLHKLQTDESKTGNHIDYHYEVQNSNFKESKALLEPNFTITIYRLNERNGAGKKEKYYWIKSQETFGFRRSTRAIREFSMTVEGVKKNIEDHYNKLFNNLD